MNLLVVLLEDRRLGLAAMGALAIVAGSAMPWIHVPQPLAAPVSASGLEGDGKIAVVLGVLALVLVLAYARLRQRDLILGAGLAGLGAAGFAIAYRADLGRNGARVVARLLSGGQAPIDPGALAEFPARAGAGIWVVLGGAAVLAVAAAAVTIRAGGTSAPDPRASS